MEAKLCGLHIKDVDIGTHHSHGYVRPANSTNLAYCYSRHGRFRRVRDTRRFQIPSMLAREIQTPVDRECVVEVILSLQSYHIRTNFFLGASAFPHRLYKNIRGHSEYLSSALIEKMIHWRIQVTTFFLTFCDANLENDFFFGPWASLTFSSSRWRITPICFSEASPAQVEGLVYGFRL